MAIEVFIPEEPQYVILFTSVSLAIGAFCRVLQPIWADYVKECNLPSILNVHYSAILQIISVILGTICYQVKALQRFLVYSIQTSILHYIFFPIIVFQSAFCINKTAYTRAMSEVIFLVLPAFFVTLTLSAFVSSLIPEVKEVTNWAEFVLICVIYATIMTPTSPSATINVLREIGDIKNIGSVLEAECVVCNSLSIVLFDLLVVTLSTTLDASTSNTPAVFILLVARYLLCGPLLGWTFAEIISYFLQKVYYDAICESTIVLSSVFLLFYIAESLDTSALAAVGVFGICLKPSSFTPEVFTANTIIWNMFSYIVTTFIYVVAGLTVADSYYCLTMTDVLFVLLVYITLPVIRFFSLSTVLSFFKNNQIIETSGSIWKNIFIMSWGSLKGAVGLGLALYLSRMGRDMTSDNYKSSLGDLVLSKEDLEIKKAFLKVVIYIVGQLLLTLIINTNTVEAVTRFAGMLRITDTQHNTMRQVVDTLRRCRRMFICMLQNDSFHCGAHWNIVRKMTKVSDPYEKFLVQEKEDDDVSSVENLSEASVSSDEEYDEVDENKLWSVAKMSKEYGTKYEYDYDMMRLRIIKTLKLAYGKQCDLGFISNYEARILIQAADTAKAKRGLFVAPNLLRERWLVSRRTSMMQIKLDKLLEKIYKRRQYKHTSKKTTIFFKIATNFMFQNTMDLIVMLNTVTLWLFYSKGSLYRFIDGLFIAAYLFEFVVTVVGVGVIQYLKRVENWMDFVVLLSAIGDFVIVSLYDVDASTPRSSFFYTIHFILITLKLIRIIRVFIIKIIEIIMEKLNSKIKSCYNVGKGFLKGDEKVCEVINTLVNDQQIQKFILMRSRQNRMQVVKELGILQRNHPRLVIGIKTKNAIRKIINKLYDSLYSLKLDGVLDHHEERLLLRKLQAIVKNVSNSLESVDPASIQELLENVRWMKGNKQLQTFVIENAELKSYDPEDNLVQEGDAPDGIYILVNGMTRTTRLPAGRLSLQKSVLSSKKNSVSTQRSIQMAEDENENYLTSGNIVGEIGVMTGVKRSATVTCETPVTTIFLSTKDMWNAFAKFPDVKEMVWNVIAIRIIAPLYQGSRGTRVMTKENLNNHLAKGHIIELTGNSKSFTVSENVSEVFLVHGSIKWSNMEDVFYGPCILKVHFETLFLAHSEFAILLVINSNTEKFSEKEWKSMMKLGSKKKLRMKDI